VTTARKLKESDQRKFMVQTAQELGSVGQRRAKAELVHFHTNKVRNKVWKSFLLIPHLNYVPVYLGLIIMVVLSAMFILTTSSTLPPQGVYESCSPSETACVDHLNQIAAGGFKLVVNYNQFWATPEQQLSYANRALSLKIKIIWGMSAPAWRDGTDLRAYYSDMGDACNCSDNAGFIRYVVNLVKNHPATWGYYIGDEAKPLTETNTVKAFSDLVKATDPNHPRLYVASAWRDISNLTPFAEFADVIATDNYPVGTDVELDSIGNVAQQGQALANDKGKKWAQVLQAFSWGPEETWVSSSRWPTRDELRQMRDLALNNANPTILLWYSYFDIINDSQAAAHWADLVSAAGAN
jgi:hypothetical protein